MYAHYTRTHSLPAAPWERGYQPRTSTRYADSASWRGACLKTRTSPPMPSHSSSARSYPSRHNGRGRRYNTHTQPTRTYMYKQSVYTVYSSGITKTVITACIWFQAQFYTLRMSFRCLLHVLNTVHGMSKIY